MFTVLILFALVLRILRVQAIQCDCSLCSTNLCEASHDFLPVHCAVIVTVFKSTNTITDVKHFCHSDLIPCSHMPVSEDTHIVYPGCCNEKDFCNRCLIPDLLPGALWSQMSGYLDPRCNLTFPHPQSPSTSFNPSPAATPQTQHVPHNVHVCNDEARYTCATIAVGCITLLVLILVPVVVLALRQRLKHRQAQTNASTLHEQGIDYDEVTETTTASYSKGSDQILLHLK